MAVQGQVGVANRFWEIGRRDYGDWQAAYVREAMQNSIDAGATEVDWTISADRKANDHNHCVVEWRNNGREFTHMEIMTKLLQHGATGKGFENTVGGFGVAKLLLLFSQVEYTLHSGEFRLTGRGGKYTLLTGQPFVPGAMFRVIVDAHPPVMEMHLADWVRLSVLPNVKVTLNGCILQSKDTRPQWTLLLDDPHFEIYRGVKAETSAVAVRLNGQFMHWQHSVRPEYAMHVELKSSQGLQANRDGLVDGLRRRLYKASKAVLAAELTFGDLQSRRAYPATVAEVRRLPPKIDGSTLSTGDYDDPPSWEPDTAEHKVLDMQPEYPMAIFTHHRDLSNIDKWDPFQNEQIRQILDQWRALCLRVAPDLVGAEALGWGVYVGKHSIEALCVHEPKFCWLLLNVELHHTEQGLVMLTCHEAAHVTHPSHDTDWAALFTDYVGNATVVKEGILPSEYLLGATAASKEQANVDVDDDA